MHEVISGTTDPILQIGSYIVPDCYRLFHVDEAAEVQLDTYKASDAWAIQDTRFQ